MCVPLGAGIRAQGRCWAVRSQQPRCCCCCPPLQAQEEELEDPLVEEFKSLRRKLFAWQSEAAAAAGVAAAGRRQPAGPVISPCQALHQPCHLHPHRRMGRGGPAGVPEPVFRDGEEPRNKRAHHPGGTLGPAQDHCPWRAGWVLTLIRSDRCRWMRANYVTLAMMCAAGHGCCCGACAPGCSPLHARTVTSVGCLQASILHLPRRRCRAGGLGGPAAVEAIQAVADGVTQCKFEATYPASDECVLHRILDVLVSFDCCLFVVYLFIGQ